MFQSLITKKQKKKQTTKTNSLLFCLHDRKYRLPITGPSVHSIRRNLAEQHVEFHLHQPPKRHRIFPCEQHRCWRRGGHLHRHQPWLLRQQIGDSFWWLSLLHYSYPHGHECHLSGGALCRRNQRPDRVYPGLCTNHAPPSKLHRFGQSCGLLLLSGDGAPLWRNHPHHHGQWLYESPPTHGGYRLGQLYCKHFLQHLNPMSAWSVANPRFGSFGCCR